MVAALIYLVIVTIAEILTASIEVRLGIVLHCVLLVILILHGSTTRQLLMRRLLLTLALAPLVRVLSISLPLAGRPLVEWYLIIGALLFAGAFFTANVTGIGYRRMGFQVKNWWAEFLIALIGFGLGAMEYAILTPKPLIAEFNWPDFLFAAAVLMIFTGLLEEFIFRGLVQQTALAIMGKWSVLYGAALFAVLHIGYLSVLDVLFVFVVGVLFGYIVQTTGSLLGVTIAHGLTNITMYLIMPFLGFNLVFSLPEQEVIPPVIAPVSVGTQTFPGFYSTATVTPTAIPLTPQVQVTGLSETPLATLTATIPVTATPNATRFACSQPPASWVIYLIRPGDTLYGLAVRYGVTVTQIQSANCLTTTTLVSGQRLYLPNVPTLTPQPATATPTPPELSPTPQPSPTTEVPTEIPPPTEEPPVSLTP